MAKAKKIPAQEMNWQQIWTQAPRKQGAQVLRAGACGPILGFSYSPLPDGLTLVLGPDLGKNSGFSVFKSKIPLLAEGEVRYPGEPVGLVCGSDTQVLKDWAGSFQVITGQPQPVSPGAEARGRTLSWGTPPQEEEGDRVFRRTFRSGTQTSLDFTPLRARILTHNGQVWLQAPTQWPKNLLEGVSRVLDSPKEQIMLFPAPCPAPLDSRLWYSTWIAAAAAALHQVSGRPVELELSKEEEQLYLPRRPEAAMTLEALLDSRGGLKGISADLVLFGGAQVVWEGEILDRMVLGLGSLFRFPSLKVSARIQLSPTPPRGPTGMGGEELTQTALGLFLSQLCTFLEEDPSRWMKAHLRDPGAPEVPLTGFFTGGILKEPPVLETLLEKAVTRTDFQRKYSACAALATRPQDPALRFRRGVGLSLGSAGTGFTASGTAPASMAMEWQPGGDLSIRTTLASPDSPLGQKWQKSAAQVLGLSPEKVRIRPWIDWETPDGGPATLSRAPVLGSRLLTLCLETLRDKKSKGAPFPLKAEKTYRRPPHLAWNSEAFTGIPYVAFSWGAAVAEVEWDRVFSRIKVSRLTLTLACGALEDQVQARIALTASVRAALGWCLVEQAGTLPWAVQRMVRQDEMPEVVVDFLPSGPKTQSRGVDNIPWAVVPPAVLSAISQATGLETDHWPLGRKDFPEVLP